MDAPLPRPSDAEFAAGDSAPKRRHRARSLTVLAATAGVLASMAGPAAHAATPSTDGSATHTAAAAASGYWHTSGNQLLDSAGNQVRIAGINWYGFETTDKVAHGLWNTDYKTVVDLIKSKGYNTIRLPFSNDVIEHPVVPSAVGFYSQDGPVNTDLKGLDSLGVMDKIIDYAGTDGLKVILDNHRSDAGNSAEQNGLWYTADYPESAWLNDWTTVATRYKDNPAVIGVDLRNEPHTPSSQPYGTGATWGTGDPTHDWDTAATKAGNAVLAVQPNWLVAVEGIDLYKNADGTVDSSWWGGNLEGAKDHPITLSVADRLVYSPHDYGPVEYQQKWFNDSTSYASLAAVWEKYWHYLSTSGTAPTWVGEFGIPNSDVGGTAAGSEGQWFSSLVKYLQDDPSIGWTYWALNGEDRYGLLDSQYQYTSASDAKQALLNTIESPVA